MHALSGMTSMEQQGKHSSFREHPTEAFRMLKAVRTFCAMASWNSSALVRCAGLIKFDPAQSHTPSTLPNLSAALSKTSFTCTPKAYRMTTVTAIQAAVTSRDFKIRNEPAELTANYGRASSLHFYMHAHASTCKDGETYRCLILGVCRKDFSRRFNVFQI